MAKERHNHLGTSEEVREKWHFYVDNCINLNDDRIVHPNTLDDHNHQIVFRSYLKSLRSCSNIDFHLNNLQIKCKFTDMGHFQAPTNFTSQRGGGGYSSRGGRGGGGMRGYGRGGRGGYSGGDHTVEKTDGKKNAIAETIAMMSKMKMEDKERKEEAEKRRAARLQREGIETGEGGAAAQQPPPPQTEPEPEPDLDPEATREQSRRNRQLQQRGRGEGRERRGHGRGGAGGGMGMDALQGAYNHQFQAGGGMGPANLMQQQVRVFS